MKSTNLKIIAITGTKGKTSTARIIDFALNQFGYKTLRVDSDGCFLNNKQIKTRKDSQKEYKSPPTVKAGKYLYIAKKKRVDFAILEQSLGSGKASNGLGYKRHDFSVFTNVYYDHIDYKKIKTRADIYKLKLNILHKTKKNSWIIANYDNKFGKKLSKSIKNNNILYYGYSKKLLQNKYYLRKTGNNIFVKLGNKDYRINLKSLPFPFNKNYKPAIYNLMASIGLLTLLDLEIDMISKVIKNYKQENFSGRLILKKIKGINILFDTAHEHISIIEGAKLCKKFGKNVLGVLRISPERTNPYVDFTAKKIIQANVLDKIIVYDFIDGIHRKESLSKPYGKPRKVGEMASIFTKSLKKYNKRKIPILKILSEQKALRKAIKLSNQNDIIFFIHHKLKEDLEYLENL